MFLAAAVVLKSQSGKVFCFIKRGHSVWKNRTPYVKFYSKVVYCKIISNLYTQVLCIICCVLTWPEAFFTKFSLPSRSSVCLWPSPTPELVDGVFSLFYFPLSRDVPTCNVVYFERFESWWVVNNCRRFFRVISVECLTLDMKVLRSFETSMTVYK
jgi:hypothetical protein